MSIFSRIMMLATVVVVGAVATSRTQGQHDAKQAALDFLDKGFALAQSQPDYWEKNTRMAGPLVRENIRLGNSYKVGRLRADDVEYFAETGEVRAQDGYSAYFPVFRENQCVGLILVAKVGDDWMAIGSKQWGMPDDSLAVDYASRGYDVSCVAARGLGGAIILTPPDGHARQVIPWGDSKRYMPELFTDRAHGSYEPMRYDEVIPIFQKRAKALVAERERDIPREDQK